MKQYDFIFYFNFLIENENNGNTSEKNYGFLVTNAQSEFSDFEKIIKQVYTIIDKHHLESVYGVHDFSSSPCHGVNAIGFTSYEVPDNKIGALMHIWRNNIQQMFSSSTVSEIYMLSNKELNTDLSVQNALIKKSNRKK